MNPSLVSEYPLPTELEHLIAFGENGMPEHLMAHSHPYQRIGFFHAL